MTLSRGIRRLAAPDYFVMQRINGWRPPRWFQMCMIASTRAGDGWLWGAYGLVLLLSFDRIAYLAFAAAATAAMLGIGTFLLLKRAIGPAEALRAISELLVLLARARSILVPFRPFDNRLCGQRSHRFVLPRFCGGSLAHCRQRRTLASDFGHALCNRCHCRIANRMPAGRRRLSPVRGVHLLNARDDEYSTRSCAFSSA